MYPTLQDNTPEYTILTWLNEDTRRPKVSHKLCDPWTMAHYMGLSGHWYKVQVVDGVGIIQQEYKRPL
jgi:hypothetical protein